MVSWVPHLGCRGRRPSVGGQARLERGWTVDEAESGEQRRDAPARIPTWSSSHQLPGSLLRLCRRCGRTRACPWWGHARNDTIRCRRAHAGADTSSRSRCPQGLPPGYDPSAAASARALPPARMTFGDLELIPVRGARSCEPANEFTSPRRVPPALLTGRSRARSPLRSAESLGLDYR